MRALKIDSTRGLTCLGNVDDGCTHQRAEDTTLRQVSRVILKHTKTGGKRTYVTDGEGTTGHVFNGQLVVTSLLHVSKPDIPPPEEQLLTFFPRSAMAFSIPTRSLPSVLRTTGVTRPFSVATATLMST